MERLYNTMEQYRYSFRELTDIHLVYGEVRSNALASERLCRERFPNRHHPSRRMFISLDRRMRETGSLQRSNEGAGNMRSTRTPDFEEEVLASVASDPTTSARRISRAMGASHSSVWRVIHEQQLHPYHPQRVHALLVTDFAPRTPVETDMELVARVVAACDVIRNTSGIFVRVRQNLVRRCQACIEVGGRHFEQLLLVYENRVRACVNILENVPEVAVVFFSDETRFTYRDALTIKFSDIGVDRTQLNFMESLYITTVLLLAYEARLKVRWSRIPWTDH
ncbi:hypothetical protein C0J52_09198 [Blattella germanica]|nr:hypothetical protein C0J52_09198 [Blattella germanica]